MTAGASSDVEACFSLDHLASRERFLAAANRAGGGVRSYPNPLKGPLGEALAADATQYAWARHIGGDVLTFIALEFGADAPDWREMALSRSRKVISQARAGLPGTAARIEESA